MTAAMGNWASEERTRRLLLEGDRWAYEKQGLFQPPGAPLPVTTVGAPPPIDVYIDDGRQGEYQYGPANQFPWLQRFWETTEIWNRLEPDGHPEHQTPVVGRDQPCLCAGPQPRHPDGERRGRTRLALPPLSGPRVAGRLAADDDRFADRSGGSRLADKHWSGRSSGAAASRSRVHVHERKRPGDRANNDTASAMPCAAGPAPLWQMVPCDNNLGLRAVIPVPGGGRRRALVHPSVSGFWASNPCCTQPRWRSGRCCRLPG